MLFEVAPDSQILGFCHFQPDYLNRPTLILIHGLEGSSESMYILGLAEKALDVGVNVVRLNLRNCGGTLHLTPTLYNAGLSADVLKVIEVLTYHHQLRDLFLIGFSLGGNLVLKASAELEAKEGNVSGVVAISPAIELETCVRSMEKGFNRLYELRFLWSLKRKILAKNKLFPNRFPISKLPGINTLREFDDTFTAPDGGYGRAENYYRVASSRPLLRSIRIPALIIAAKDDPLVPFSVFEGTETDFVKVLSPEHGGHAAFIQDIKQQPNAQSRLDYFWVDHQIINFCIDRSQLL